MRGGFHPVKGRRIFARTIDLQHRASWRDFSSSHRRQRHEPMAIPGRPMDAVGVPRVDPELYPVAFQRLVGAAPECLFLARNLERNGKGFVVPAAAQLGIFRLAFQSSKHGNLIGFRKRVKRRANLIDSITFETVPKQQVSWNLNWADSRHKITSYSFSRMDSNRNGFDVFIEKRLQFGSD